MESSRTKPAFRHPRDQYFYRYDRWRAARERSPQLRRVLESINGYLGADLGVIELASVAGLSPYYFGNLFRASMARRSISTCWIAEWNVRGTCSPMEHMT
jgi:transcriptional regulator GlxA family with amidase domain